MATQHNYSHSDRSAVDGDSAALVRSSDEEQATSSARREGSQEPTPPPRLSLTSLPTEILDTICAYVARDKYNHFVRPKKLEEILLNKRYFQIAYPRWIEQFRCCESGGRSDGVLAEWAMNPKAARSVKELEVEFGPGLPQLQCAILRNLSHLTHLSILFVGEEDLIPLPDCFYSALRSLLHLVCLIICYDYRDEAPEGFSFAVDVPSLRELHIWVLGELALSAPGLSNLAKLQVESLDFASSGIPWPTLEHLVLRNIPLRTLDISSPFSIRQIGPLFELLRAPNLSSLSLGRIKHLAELEAWSCTARFPSVEGLTLHGGNSTLTSLHDLHGLQAILALVPAIKTLRLKRFDVLTPNIAASEKLSAETLTKEAILQSLDQRDLSYRFPYIASLLFFLQQTTILDFYFHLSLSHGIRWRRYSTNEVFEAEGWTTI